MSDAARLDRALGAYLGLAIGDALGGTVEFMSPARIRDRYGVHRSMIGGGWLDLKPGQVTDDTEMSIVLGRSLIAHRDFHPRHVAEAFVSWLRRGPIDVGGTVQHGLQRFMIDGSVAGPVRDRDGGNGAVMRNLPVVLATLDHDDRFEAWTLGQSHITHNHPLSDAAGLALGRMVRLLIDGKGLPAAGAEAAALIARYPTFAFDPYAGKATAFIVDTVQTVFHGFFGADTFEDRLVRTVNLGGDADTTGALVGMLAGAAGGMACLPSDWLAVLDAKVAAEIRGQVPKLLALG